jgi:adhesin/invasin
LNQDGTLNASANSEVRGRTIVVYLTGQGAVAPAVPTGQAAPNDQLSIATLPSTATIGGATATVSFLGLAPGFVGLGQANIVIPVDSQTGDNVSLTIMVGTQPSNTVSLSVR